MWKVFGCNRFDKVKEEEKLPPKPAFLFGVPLQNGIEFCARKVGPERIGKIQLSVRRLPQEEVGEAPSAAGAHDQVNIGHRVCPRSFSAKARSEMSPPSCTICCVAAWTISARPP
ncbi:MAG: hypothetical protein KatS3mg100_019 [Candidatus Parcubacteria bacterium]|nr:MAG: hypothetical protein KatS3mg100_019 [Candidatus Parcubacteria bacterium]